MSGMTTIETHAPSVNFVVAMMIATIERRDRTDAR